MNPTQSAVDPKQHGSKNGDPPTARNADGSVPQHLDSVLNDEMLARFASRAASYDRENRFFTEDFEELRAAKVPSVVFAGGIRRARQALS
jgi:hypothetical protein